MDFLQRPNAVQPAITVQTVVQAVQLLIPVLMPQLLNAEVVAIIVPVVAQVALRLFPVLRVIQKLPLAQPNVALLAMNALRTILATTILQKLVIMDVLLTIPTVRQSARPVTPITATTEPPSSLPVRQTRPAPISPTAPPKFRAGPPTPGINKKEAPAKKHKPPTGCPSASKNFTNAKQFGLPIRKMPFRHITTAVENTSRENVANPTASNAVICNAAQTQKIPGCFILRGFFNYRSFQQAILLVIRPSEICRLVIIIESRVF